MQIEKSRMERMPAISRPEKPNHHRLCQTAIAFFCSVLVL
jgi:hypothetical protein